MSSRNWLIAGIVCLVLSQLLAVVAYPMRPAANLDVALGPEVTEGEQQLSEVFQDLEPGEFAGTLMLGGLRGLVTDLVWMRAMDAKETKQYYESVALFGLISKLQPRFIKVWEFGSHDMAYNIGYEAESREDKFAWFQAGLEFNRQGVLRNPRSEGVLRHLAWMFYHKGETLMPEVEATDWAAFINPILARFDDPGVGYGSGQVTELQTYAGESWQITGTWATSSRPTGTPVLLFNNGIPLGSGTIVSTDEQQFIAQLPTADLGEEVLALLKPNMPVQVSEQVGNYDISSRLYRGCIELDARVEEKPSPYVRRFIGISLSNDGNRLRNRGQHLAALRQYLKALEEWQDILAFGLDNKNGFRPDEERVNRASYQRNDGRLRRRCSIIGHALAPNEKIGSQFTQAVMQRDFAKAWSLLDEPNWSQAVNGVGSIQWLDEMQPN